MPGSGDSSLVKYDRDLVEIPQIQIMESGYFVELQFPPRITSDTKSSDWDVKPTRSYEPIKTYFGSEARALTLELEYIATDRFFTPEKIADITKEIKKYFYMANINDISKRYPTIRIANLYGFVSKSSAFFRLMNYSISVGDTLVGDPRGIVWPLYSKIILSLELATRIGGEKTNLGGTQDVEPLPNKAEFEWY